MDLLRINYKPGSAGIGVIHFLSKPFGLPLGNPTSDDDLNIAIIIPFIYQRLLTIPESNTRSLNRW